LNYLLDWGRLCIPNLSDSNNRRWEEAPLWGQVRELARTWADGIDWPVSRHGKEYHGITQGYVNFVSGTISGAMARFGMDNPSMMSVINGLEDNGHKLEAIQRMATKKASLFKRL
jgi:hypothetical protein